jgi:glyoxylase-like metal-dependent hydrolase (beta-lactamase superfamily II)
MTAAPEVCGFFDNATNAVTYLVWDDASREAVVVDPVLDFDPASGRVHHNSVETVLQASRSRALRIAYVLETHAHADHLSGAQAIVDATGAKLGIGARISEVQEAFGPMFGADDIRPDGQDFDLLLREGDCLPLGALMIEVIEVPGHTPADVAYRIGDAVFVGDSMFMPDYGTARTDFPGGDARQLYRSIQKLLALPPETRLFMCHDYKAPGRDEFRWETTVADERNNVHLANGTTEDAFVAMRESRDATLATPKLLLPSIQVNIRGGRFPPPGPDGRCHLRIPVQLN